MDGISPNVLNFSSENWGSTVSFLKHVYKSVEQIIFKIGLHDAICLSNSLVFTPGHCLKLEVMKYKSASLKRMTNRRLH